MCVNAHVCSYICSYISLLGLQMGPTNNGIPIAIRISSTQILVSKCHPVRRSHKKTWLIPKLRQEKYKLKEKVRKRLNNVKDISEGHGILLEGPFYSTNLG